jgi:biofilm PGA synthesis N-glycosyltransferase PgaC
VTINSTGDTLVGSYSSLTLSVVVPFLNEEAYLPRFLRSVAAQTRPPDELLLIDDGSYDGSPGIAAAFVREYSYARCLRLPARPHEPDRLATAAEFKAFKWGCARSEIAAEVVAKMDADLDLQPTHFAEIMDAMARDRGLGVVGAYLATRLPSGELLRETHSDDHVRGPNKFYRRACLEQILTLPPLLGWDAIDDVKARQDGWRTKNIALSAGDSVHLRPTGLHDGRLRAFRRWGRVHYVSGSHPLKVIAGSLWRFRERPYVLCGVNHFYGWAAAGARRTPRFEPTLLRYRRQEDLRRMRSMLMPWLHRLAR